jgi:energy-coupling factor transporter ATP-binding protein EcfA2
MARLRKTWSFADDVPLLVVGRLSPADIDAGTFGFLVSLEDPFSGRKLVSPLSGQPAGAFISPPEMAAVRSALQDFSGDVWAMAEVQFSPFEVREQRRDPFALMLVPGSLKPLTEVPKEWSVTVTGPVEARQMHKVAYDAIAYRLGKEAEVVRRSLDAETNEHRALLAREESRLDQVRASSTAEEARLVELNEAGAGLQQDIALMQERLRTMAELVTSRAQRLEALGLLDPGELARLLPGSPSLEAPAGRSYDDTLNGDFTRVAPFVQARLWQNGIRYSQAQLRDFLALLHTHDLIILAGDSGSGKTSLVKQVAGAIGARHKVIPVKPNWTGPEDLLGYYNPIERAYQPTPFLEALQAAAAEPEVLHLICLDEMNLARVEYYFADFLSLLEDRAGAPEIVLYASGEEQHAVIETGLFVAVEEEVRRKTGLPDSVTIEDMLRNEAANALLHRLSGLADAQSVLEYHGRLRRSLAAATRHPTRFAFPSNVRIIGAVNMDETTHPLSPKVLDRVHVMRFRNPALLDWDAVADEVEDVPGTNEPLMLVPSAFAPRADYPPFDPTDPETALLLRVARDFLDPIGVEFGLRAIRQSRGYLDHAAAAGLSVAAARNNVVLHKILPKLAFDAGRRTPGGSTRLEVLQTFATLLHEINEALDPASVTEDAAALLERMIHAAEDNNRIINFWSR